MTLIKSISGIRGTIGGEPGDGLTPLDIVKFSSAYGMWVKSQSTAPRSKVVVGRDARISGSMVSQLVMGALRAVGVDVVNIGLATTPTTELAVVMEGAQGGLILTASHNPTQWNALKMLNSNGEFLTAAEGDVILKMVDDETYEFEEVYNLGQLTENSTYNERHIQEVLKLKLVDVAAIKAANFSVAIDCVNSVGGIVIPQLLKALGVQSIEEVNCEPNGDFAHNPEPLPSNLYELSELVVAKKCHVGFAVDPDVDRLAIICENGEMFGEEYTLVSVADYVLQNTPGNTVSNMSSTRALKDVTEKYGCKYQASEVGEVNVVATMKANKAIIGGEGNGGVIYPESHYGRDALVGIALFLTHLAKCKLSVSALRATYPNYFMSKNKIELTPTTNVDAILEQIKANYKDFDVDDRDGIKINLPSKWVHLRKSNTEPIIRVYSEAMEAVSADDIAQQMVKEIEEISQKQ